MYDLGLGAKKTPFVSDGLAMFNVSKLSFQQLWLFGAFIFIFSEKLFDKNFELFKRKALFCFPKTDMKSEYEQHQTEYEFDFHIFLYFQMSSVFKTMQSIEIISIIYRICKKFYTLKIDICRKA